MNNVKIINNNIGGKSDGSNYYSYYDSYGVRIYSDHADFFETENAPNCIISNNFISGAYSSAISSLNNSKISGNTISGTASLSGISCLQDSEIKNNKINCDCLIGVSATKNSNIVGNQISNFTQYGVKAFGNNISENIISRQENRTVEAFVSGDTANNQPMMVVDNVFSHESCDPEGLDKRVVKNRSTSWVVERNLPNYSIETPIRKLRTVGSLQSLYELTGMNHNDIAMVSSPQAFGTAPSSSSYGLFRFVVNSTKDEFQDNPNLAVITVRSKDETGSWHSIDYSRYNQALGIPRISADGYLEINSSGVKNIEIQSTGSMSVLGTGPDDLNPFTSHGTINLINGGRMNVYEHSSIKMLNESIIDCSGTGRVYGGNRDVVKWHTLSNGNDLIIRPGNESWADEYIIDNLSTNTTSMGSVALKCDGIYNILNYLGLKIRFSYDLSSTAHGTVYFIYLYDSNGGYQTQVALIKQGGSNWDINAGTTRITGGVVEYILVKNPKNDQIGWHRSSPL